MNTANQSQLRHYNRLIAEIDEVYHEVALRFGLSDSEMSILYSLSDNGGHCLLRDLIKLSGVNKQTVNSALRKLEKDDIILLKPDDGKLKRVSLTAKGIILARDTVDKVLNVEKKIYSSWVKKEWEIYFELTERYLNQIRKEFREI